VSLLVDEHFDSTIFDSVYNNDDVGRRAYHIAMMLRAILSAYALGFTSSCRSSCSAKRTLSLGHWH
jgi:transposase